MRRTQIGVLDSTTVQPPGFSCGVFLTTTQAVTATVFCNGWAAHTFTVLRIQMGGVDFTSTTLSACASAVMLTTTDHTGFTTIKERTSPFMTPAML
jgi:hypothetical protein